MAATSSRAASAPSAAPSAASSAPPSATSDACPATYRSPDPKRPALTLTFAFSPDLTTVHGTEHISFTPDLAINELIFRLTANTVPTALAGNRIVVTSASVDHGGGAPTYTRDAASSATQGGLLHLPFAAPIAPGTTVTADVAFDVTLGDKSFDRFGRTGSGTNRFAWLGSAHPLLAWEHGYGWHTEPMLQFTAESATSEAMRTDLTVTAPAADTVIMSGRPEAGVSAGVNGANGNKTWHSTVEAARDVSVAAGPFVFSDVDVNGVALRVGAPTAQGRDDLTPKFVRAINELVARFGPFPFPSLSVARLPASGGGIEYPSSILMFDDTPLVAVHETAHQYFYAMLGNSQAQHAWLDESFATLAEELINSDPEPQSNLAIPGAVDRPTADYGSGENEYYFFTYAKGAAALEAARTAAGGAPFDSALRCYVAANAWRIVNPADFQTALAALPAAVAVLRTAQAFS